MKQLYTSILLLVCVTVQAQINTDSLFARYQQLKNKFTGTTNEFTKVSNYLHNDFNRFNQGDKDHDIYVNPFSNGTILIRAVYKAPKWLFQDEIWALIADSLYKTGKSDQHKRDVLSGYSIKEQTYFMDAGDFVKAIGDASGPVKLRYMGRESYSDTNLNPQLIPAFKESYELTQLIIALRAEGKLP